MTNKDRMLVALQGEKPDRLPVTIHQWQKYHLDSYMGGMTDIEAFKATGLDAAITYFPLIETKSNEWQISVSDKRFPDCTEISRTIKTPSGILTYKEGVNDKTRWTTEHIIKNDEDIYLLKDYCPIPKLDKNALKDKYDLLGDGGILRSHVFGNQAGCWQDACYMHGTQEMIYACYDKPDWVHEFLNILLERKIIFIEESIKGSCSDLIETGGGASSNNIISPDIHEKFCLPYDKIMHDAIHDAGKKTVYHTCGGMTKILDMILKNNCDASETLSPTGMGGDITPENEHIITEKFINKITMIGGLDQFNILTDGTPEQVHNEVVRLFNSFGSDGGYILSASDHFFDAPPENLEAMGMAALNCKY